MITVEQAIFTAAGSPRRTGCPLASVSPGVNAGDLRELAQWGASPGALAAEESLSFHPLPSGAYCVSRTLAWGAASDGEAERTWLHCLVASPQALRRFANHPLALFAAAQAAGLLPPGAPLPPRLPALSLEPRVAVVDQALLARLAQAGGAPRLGALAQAALQHSCLALAGDAALHDWIAGLITCLPIECRPEFSFCTGLRFSPARPFRIFGWTGAVEELRRLEQQFNVGVFDLTPAAPLPLLEGWGRLVERVVSSGQVSFLATQFSKRRFELTPDDLPALGLQLLEDFEAGLLRGDEAPTRAPAERGLVHGDILQWAHASHRGPQTTPKAVTSPPRMAGPAQTLQADSPEVQARLEALDDAVWEAVGGSPQALEALQRLWPRLRAELGDELLTESREQYLRYALSIWEQYMGDGKARNPHQAVHALDVLCVLFDRV